jgi:hypothetical protein
MTFAPAQILFAVIDRVDYFFRDNVGRNCLNVIDLTVASSTFDHKNRNKTTGDKYEPLTVRLALSYRYRPAEFILWIQRLVSLRITDDRGLRVKERGFVPHCERCT